MFTQACKYAIRAVIYLTSNSSEDNKLRINTIADNLNIPMPFLGKILQKLSKDNLISSSKGPGGGFYLEEKDKKNRLISVVESIDGKGILDKCILGLEQCNAANPCLFHDSFTPFKAEIMNFIYHKNFEEVANDIKAGKIRDTVIRL